MAEEEAKPEGLSEHINLKVTSQDGNVVHFKAKRGTQFRKLMKAYCERQSFQPESVVFMYDGERLRGDQTPADVDMQDQDSIDVMIHQVSHDRALLQHPCIAGHASYSHLKTCCRSGRVELSAQQLADRGLHKPLQEYYKMADQYEARQRQRASREGDKDRPSPGLRLAALLCPALPRWLELPALAALLGWALHLGAQALVNVAVFIIPLQLWYAAGRHPIHVRQIQQTFHPAEHRVVAAAALLLTLVATYAAERCVTAAARRQRLESKRALKPSDLVWLPVEADPAQQQDALPAEDASTFMAPVPRGTGSTSNQQELKALFAKIEQLSHKVDEKRQGPHLPGRCSEKIASEELERLCGTIGLQYSPTEDHSIKGMHLKLAELEGIIG